MAIPSWWATGCSTLAWAQKLASCPTSFPTDRRESLPSRTWKSGQNMKLKCRRSMASDQDHGANQFTAEQESQVKKSSLFCTFDKKTFPNAFTTPLTFKLIMVAGYENALLLKGCLFYCLRVLMEFAIMIQLPLYLLKQLRSNKK